jgi:DUF1680 family protein
VALLLWDLPQITADYGISSYLSAPEGVYVNLYVPSQLKWTQQGTRCTLRQRTEYPYKAETTIELQMEKPVDFAVYLRVPAWAGPATHLAVNGKASSVALKPGSFAAVKQTWKNGDRIEFTIDRPLRLSPVDPQHPNLVALLQGPVTLFAVGNVPADLTRKNLLAAEQRTAGEWRVPSSAESLTLIPYPAIKEETYRLYLPVTS